MSKKLMSSCGKRKTKELPKVVTTGEKKQEGKGIIMKSLLGSIHKIEKRQMMIVWE